MQNSLCVQVLRSPSVFFFRLPDDSHAQLSLSQQLLVSVSGTVHDAVSSSTYPCDPLIACVCAECQSISTFSSLVADVDC